MHSHSITGRLHYRADNLFRHMRRATGENPQRF